MNTKHKVLIIDDEIDLAQMVGFQFKARGFDVQTAVDGLDGLQKLQDFKPELIILDINMPRMGGIEFYSKICDPDGKPLYPVLVLTARANVQNLFKDLNINGFMVKPFEIDDLVREAQVIIDKSKSARPDKSQSYTKDIRSVCIVEENQQEFDRLSTMFLNAGYTVMPARSGTEAIERMMKFSVHAALIHLGLPDISGDIIIFRLSQMAKTMDIKCVLYTSKDNDRDREIMKKIGAKTGVKALVEYDSPQKLLDSVNALFV